MRTITYNDEEAPWSRSNLMGNIALLNDDSDKTPLEPFTGTLGLR
jgi:hypothetical protein